ncbi:MAG: sulfite exporter TauE/SafE family protein [Deltaproteobacteria bacterium]|nr:MAG: sulfite exporter TauE/SafE family protein [Deltaproteobacteria bacterium]
MPVLFPQTAGILLAGGLLAGFINTLAGGGSFLTVPLLILVGVPPSAANGTNRVAVLIQNVAAMRGFAQEGVPGPGLALRLLPATLLGAWLGAWGATHVPDEVFRRLFALIMLLALPIVLRNPVPAAGAPARALPLPLQLALYFSIGLYGGAIQAGIGIPLLLALAGAGGLDLVRANSVKVVLIAALTAVALAQFAWAGMVHWMHGLVLAIGSATGAYLASRVGARVGERLIRPLLVLSVAGLALRLLLGH